MPCHKVTFSADDLGMGRIINKIIYWLMQLCRTEGWDFMITPDTLYDIRVSSRDRFNPKKIKVESRNVYIYIVL